jgi:hypothetical protein
VDALVRSVQGNTEEAQTGGYCALPVRMVVVKNDFESKQRTEKHAFL